MFFSWLATMATGEAFLTLRSDTGRAETGQPDMADARLARS